jgi:hypothetical protein
MARSPGGRIPKRRDVSSTAHLSLSCSESPQPGGRLPLKESEEVVMGLLGFALEMVDSDRRSLEGLAKLASVGAGTGGWISEGPACAILAIDFWLSSEFDLSNLLEGIVSSFWGSWKAMFGAMFSLPSLFGFGKLAVFFGSQIMWQSMRKGKNPDVFGCCSELSSPSFFALAAPISFKELLVLVRKRNKNHRQRF